jgi:hypothetical protein
MLAGAQMVAINWQYRDEYWYIYNTIFCDGAYRKKPNLEKEEFVNYSFKLKFNQDKLFQYSKLRYYKCITKFNNDYDIKNYIDYNFSDIIIINGLNLHVFAIFIDDVIIPFECTTNIMKKKFNNSISATAFKYYEDDDKKFLPNCTEFNSIFEPQYEIELSYLMELV